MHHVISVGESRGIVQGRVKVVGGSFLKALAELNGLQSWHELFLQGSSNYFFHCELEAIVTQQCDS